MIFQHGEELIHIFLELGTLGSILEIKDFEVVLTNGLMNPLGIGVDGSLVNEIVHEKISYKSGGG